MKKTLKSITSAVIAAAMLGSTAVSISAYNTCPEIGFNDEEIEYVKEYISAVSKADGMSDEDIERLNSVWGDKDYPNPNNEQESKIIPEWYINGEPIPDWIIGEYFERCCPDNEHYTERYREAFEAVCNANGVTKEEVVNDVKIRDKINIRDDIDFDGEVTIKDLMAVKKHLIKDSELTSIQKFTLNDDSSVSIKDVARISQKLVEG